MVPSNNLLTSQLRNDYDHESQVEGISCIHSLRLNHRLDDKTIGISGNFEKKFIGN